MMLMCVYHLLTYVLLVSLQYYSFLLMAAVGVWNM